MILRFIALTTPTSSLKHRTVSHSYQDTLEYLKGRGGGAYLEPPRVKELILS